MRKMCNENKGENIVIKEIFTQMSI